MDQLRVLRVVIASPGDVKPEREIIPRVVEEVNRNIARPRGLHLEVYRWETDSYPGFHPEGPQGLIDPILKIEDCDILIGIFWRRFGTPVSDAKSGTEHEFRLAYEAWKKNRKPQIMVYFSQKPYAPKSKEETDQWGLVLQFKKEFPREGLWWDYKNKGEFEERTRNHLTNFLSTQFPIDKPTSEPATLTPRFQLPPPPADFTGREAELRDLRVAIEKGGVHISGLQGQGGVGKTARIRYRLVLSLICGLVAIAALAWWSHAQPVVEITAPAPNTAISEESYVVQGLSRNIRSGEGIWIALRSLKTRRYYLHYNHTQMVSGGR